jgi:hypothetical protein
MRAVDLSLDPLPNSVPPILGVVRPMRATVVREVNGWPVVVHYEAEGPLWAHRQWGRFGRRAA